MNANEVHLVVVTADDGQKHAWAAATPRDEAIDRVLDVVPEGWAAQLLDDPIKADPLAPTTIPPGALRELRKA